MGPSVGQCSEGPRKAIVHVDMWTLRKFPSVLFRAVQPPHFRKEFLHVKDNPFDDFYFCWSEFNFSAVIVSIKLFSYPNNIYFVLLAFKRRFPVTVYFKYSLRSLFFLINDTKTEGV